MLKLLNYLSASLSLVILFETNFNSLSKRLRVSLDSPLVVNTKLSHSLLSVNRYSVTAEKVLGFSQHFLGTV